MKLNHLNLTVSNVLETHRFLVKHFGLKDFGTLAPREAMSFLSDDNGMVLALFRAAAGTELKYPPGFHIGFVQESEERVNEINETFARGWVQGPKARPLAWLMNVLLPVAGRVHDRSFVLTSGGGLP